MLVPSVSAVFPFRRFTVSAFRSFFSVSCFRFASSGFSLSVLPSPRGVSKTQLSVSRAALRPFLLFNHIVYVDLCPLSIYYKYICVYIYIYTYISYYILLFVSFIFLSLFVSRAALGLGHAPAGRRRGEEPDLVHLIMLHCVIVLHRIVLRDMLYYYSISYYIITCYMISYYIIS